MQLLSEEEKQLMLKCWKQELKKQAEQEILS